MNVTVYIDGKRVPLGTPPPADGKWHLFQVVAS
jgi:hypothetical protein